MWQCLVAEDFEELMIVTCNLRNEDSTIDWYLIQAAGKCTHNELSFHHVARPTIDIQTERKAEAEESEFWAPVRGGELGELFAGKPVPISNEGWISEVYPQYWSVASFLPTGDAIFGCTSWDLITLNAGTR